MPGHHLTQSELALQLTVECFGNLLFALEEHHLTHIYCMFFHFCELENIGFLVLKYLNTSTLTFEEFSEKWLFDREV